MYMYYNELGFDFCTILEYR